MNQGPGNRSTGRKGRGRPRDARAPSDLSASVTERRHSEKAALFPSIWRSQIVRFAGFFQRLYDDTGLSNTQMRDAVVLHIAADLRHDGLSGADANTIAERLAPGASTIGRLANPTQLLVQEDVGFWLALHVAEAGGSSGELLIRTINSAATERERDLAQNRRLAAFERRFNMLGESDQQWTLDFMQQIIERRQLEEKARTAGLARIDDALGFGGAPPPHTGDETKN